MKNCRQIHQRNLLQQRTLRRRAKNTSTVRGMRVGNRMVLRLCLPGHRVPRKKEPSPQRLADPTSGSTYVGSETCKGCHEDQFKNIEASPHYRTNLPKIRGEEVHGCESCHGPGSAHVEGGGDKTKIFTFKGARPEEITKRCMTCHEANPEQREFMRSTHNENGITCTILSLGASLEAGISAGTEADAVVLLLPRRTESRFPEAVPSSRGRGADQVHRLPQSRTER